MSSATKNLSDDTVRWLKANGSLRMDATLDLFPVERRLFHLARYHFASAYIEGMGDLRVADIACGTGYGAAHLGRCGRSVVGIDIDGPAVEYATRTHGTEAVRFVAAPADATGLPDNSVDMVMSFETLEHVLDDRSTVAEFCRLLVPGGLLICSVPNDWGLSKHHVRNYTAESLLNLLSPSFASLEVWNQNSGCEWHRNHGKPAGITKGDPATAECLIAVGVKR